ncbi:MAG: phosphonate C-P lyase system protein PhnG [Neptuniibacter sp.]
MSLKDTDCNQSERQAWMAVLARTPADRIRLLLEDLPEQASYSMPRPVETGLAMVRGRVSANGEPFNLGETTITRCVVQLDDNTTGIAYVTGRDKKQAELAALADALLQNQTLPLSRLEPLEKAIQDKRQKRAEEVASTKVDFFTLVRGED